MIVTIKYKYHDWYEVLTYLYITQLGLGHWRILGLQTDLKDTNKPQIDALKQF